MNALRPWFRQVSVPTSRSEFDALLGDVFSPLNWGWDRWSASAAAGSPRLNVWEENDVYCVEAEVPGLKSEDLELSVVGNQFTLKGRRGTSADQATTFHRRERGHGEFVRTLGLPAEVAADQVTASLADGVLTVKLPKAEAAKPRKISVNQ